MTATQPELFAAKAADPNVAWLTEVLFNDQGWLTASELHVISGLRLSDREVRALAEAAAPKIISGQRGYKHTDHATPEEITHFIKTMQSQATKMSKRAHAVRQYTHARIG